MTRPFRYRLIGAFDGWTDIQKEFDFLVRWCDSFWEEITQFKDVWLKEVKIIALLSLWDDMDWRCTFITSKHKIAKLARTWSLNHLKYVKATNIVSLHQVSIKNSYGTTFLSSLLLSIVRYGPYNKNLTRF